MAIENRIYSDLDIPPGEYLSEVLASKGMTQTELASRIGRPIQAINEIIKGEKAITPATAIQLERAVDVPAHIWTGLEARYQLIKARREERSRLQREIPHLRNIPYKQLADLGCVPKSRDKEFKVREAQSFYGVSSLENLPGVSAYEASFRCGAVRRASNYALAAWIRCAELRAASVPTGTFYKRKLRGSLELIRGLCMKDPAEFMPELKKILTQCGVVLVLLPHFPKTYAHGATFWIKPDKAVLLMSLRGRWADVFWFSLFHELGHILLHKKRTFIDSEEVRPEVRDQEREADAFAAQCLIPAAGFSEFVRKGEFDGPAIERFAREIGVTAGIVVGRLQHEGLVASGSALNRLRERYEWK